MRQVIARRTSSNAVKAQAVVGQFARAKAAMVLKFFS
jgi:hypothetical protein